MSIVNQIPPLNLNPVFIRLENIRYSFANNKDDIISNIDSELEPLKTQRKSIRSSIDDLESDIEVEPLEVTPVEIVIPIVDSSGGDISGTVEVKTIKGCSSTDKNKRKQSIITALEIRENELDKEINSLEKERKETNSFYNDIINAIVGVISNLLSLLKRLVDNILIAIQSIEVAVVSLAAIPLGAGVSASTSLGFIGDLLQTKIYEPVSDTISQQERYDEGV